MTTAQARKLFYTCRDVLTRWADTLRTETGDLFNPPVPKQPTWPAGRGRSRTTCLEGSPVDG